MITCFFATGTLINKIYFSIQTVKATSPLDDPRVTYNLEEGLVPETNMPVRFYIKPNRVDSSASILVAENLDYEMTRFFTLRVRVQNVAAVPLASFSTVYVNVTGKTGYGEDNMNCFANQGFSAVFSPFILIQTQFLILNFPHLFHFELFHFKFK